MPAWLTVLIAVVLFGLIGGGGLAFLRGIAVSRARERIDPEDVEALAVFFVCGECGTEFQVTRLGEIQVPRHCGEPMNVIRRPQAQPLDT